MGNRVFCNLYAILSHVFLVHLARALRTEIIVYFVSSLAPHVNLTRTVIYLISIRFRLIAWTVKWPTRRARPQRT